MVLQGHLRSTAQHNTQHSTGIVAFPDRPIFFCFCLVCLSLSVFLMDGWMMYHFFLIWFVLKTKTKKQKSRKQRKPKRKRKHGSSKVCGGGCCVVASTIDLSHDNRITTTDRSCTFLCCCVCCCCCVCVCVLLFPVCVLFRWFVLNRSLGTAFAIMSCDWSILHIFY